MILLTPQQTATLYDWFMPDRPGPLVGLHVIQTGHGVCYADRWPQPRALLVDMARNYALVGDPHALEPDDLRRHIAGGVDAPKSFAPLLKATFRDLRTWDRLIYELPTHPRWSAPTDIRLRRLTSTDAYHVWGLGPDVDWIAKTWGGPAGLAASGYAWGAFAGGRLVSLSCSFFVGVHFEDVGVVTEPEFRGQGLSVACTGALCEEIIGRGRRPCWSTSPDNNASRRVAEKIGFVECRQGVLYVTGIDIPAPPKKDGSATE